MHFDDTKQCSRSAKGWNSEEWESYVHMVIGTSQYVMSEFPNRWRSIIDLMRIMLTMQVLWQDKLGNASFFLGNIFVVEDLQRASPEEYE